MNLKELTMYQGLKDSSEKYPNATALFYLGRRFTFAETLLYSDMCAAAFDRLGLKKGDVITLALPNTPSAVFSFYGANKLGLIANMVHPLTPTEKLVEIMKTVNSDTAVLLDSVYLASADLFKDNGICVLTVSPSDYMPKLKRGLYNLINKRAPKSTTLISMLFSGVTETADNYRDPKVYLHSGGTTGSPKTIVLSDFNFNALAINACDILGCERNESLGMLAVLPLFHGFGLCMAVHAPIVNGFTSILIPKFDVKMIISAMKKTNVTYMTGVPTMYEKLLSSKKFVSNPKLKNLSFAFCGGDSMPLPLKERFDKILQSVGGEARMYEGYGLTETVTVCAVNTSAVNRKASVGKAVGDLDIRIFDDNLQELPRGEMGQIAVRGDTVMLGYLGDKEATDATISNGYVLSGDLGYMDEDGFVYFKQRLKRIIKVSGVAVFPTEIENEVMKLPLIKLACAVGVPEEKTGSIVKLFVVLKDGKKATVETENEIKRFLSTALIRWAVPKYIEFRDTLPTTVIGKVDYKQLS